MQWYYAIKGQQYGPIEWEALVSLALEGKLSPMDLVWNTSMGNQWVKAATIPDLFAANTAPLSAPPSASEWAADTRFASQTPNGELTAAARAALSGRWGLAVGGGVVYLLLSIGLSVVPMFIPVLGHIAAFLVTGALMLGCYLFFLKMSRREEAPVGLLFEGFKQFGSALLANLMMTLLVIAWAIPGVLVAIIAAVLALKGVKESGGSPLPVLLILFPVMFAAMIPALMAQYRYFMTYFVMNDMPGIGGIEAIRHSARLMNGSKWKLFCLQFRFLGWALLCIPTLGIGFLWLMPYMMTSFAIFYDDLRRGQTRG